MRIIQDCKVRNDPLEDQELKNKDRSLGADKTKIPNQSYKKNFGEYSFKDRSLPWKDLGIWKS